MTTRCRHFGICGGCVYQDLPDADYRALKRSIVLNALARHGFGHAEIAGAIEVPPGTRRRAVFKIAKKSGITLIGFHAAKSHAIVDMRECLVLKPILVALVQKLREAMGSLLREGEDAELHVTDSDTGVDVGLRWGRAKSSQPELARLAQSLGIVRVTAGQDILVERAKPEVALGKARIVLPPDSFLQPTRVGEEALQARVLEVVNGARTVVDLFSGCGTFTFPLADTSSIHAVDSDGPALQAFSDAARKTQGLKPVTTEKRDLFKRPLMPAELNRFAAAVLDPPRAGAAAQCEQLGMSKIGRIGYVSCNPESFARDARILTDAGFELGTIVPVDQFLWSSHIELVASFVRS